jgi:glycosyltransferase involved in cell wall biosynthesis
MSNKKIAFIIGYYPLNRGGAELQAYYIAKELKCEFDIFFISIGHDKEQVIYEEGFRIYLLKKSKLWNRFTMHCLVKKKLFKILDDEKPELLFQSVGFAVTGLVSEYGRKKNIKSVFSVQRDDEAYSYKFKLLYPNPLMFIDDLFRIRGIKNADYIITQTRLQETLIKKNYKKCIALMLYSFAPLPEKVIKQYNNGLKVVWIANLKQIKQPHIFVNIVKKILTDKAIDNNVEFIMAGRSTDDKYCRQMFVHAKEAGIKYLGEISNNDVNKLLNESHLLVNTSKYEGFANVFVQAWLRGVPVITLRADPDNIISVNRMGFYSKTELNMEEDLIKLINNIDLLKEFSDNAIKFSHENLSMSNIDNVRGLFMKILN